MDVLAEFDIAGIIAVSIWGGLMIYWCTDFFGFLHRLIMEDSHKVHELEDQILKLEGELNAYKQLVQKPTLEPALENSLSGDLQGVGR